MSNYSRFNLCVADKVVEIYCNNFENIQTLKHQMKDFIYKKGSDYKVYIGSEDVLRKSSFVIKNKKPIEMTEPEEIISEQGFYKIDNSYYSGTIRNKIGEFKIKVSNSIPIIIRNIIRNCYLIWFIDELIGMHGSGIIHDNRGVLFCGEAGAGKSTIAKKSNQVLNDEFIMLQSDRKKVFMHSTPFGGELEPINDYVILEKVFFIKQHKKTIIDNITSTEKFLGLIKHNHLFNRVKSDKEPVIIKKIFQKTKDLSHLVKAYKLRFSLNMKLEDVMNETQ